MTKPILIPDEGGFSLYSPADKKIVVLGIPSRFAFCMLRQGVAVIESIKAEPSRRPARSIPSMERPAP